MEFNIFSSSHKNNIIKPFYCKMNFLIDYNGLKFIDFRYYKNEIIQINWIG